MRNKERMDKVVNTIAAMAIIAILIGGLAWIWIGIPGAKILASGVLLLVWDFIISLWFRMDKGDRKGRYNR